MPMAADPSPEGPSPEVLFRYHVVSQVLACMHRGGSRCECVHATAAGEHPGFGGSFRRVAERTVYRWLATYMKHGVAGLRPAERPCIEGSLALPEDFLEFLAGQKRDDPRVSIPEVIERAKLLGKLTDAVDRVTAWRAARRLGIATRRVRRPKWADRDARRFAYSHRMQMVLCDGKHFRAGASRARRVALFFLDDAFRFGLHVVVGTSESTPLFLRGLYEKIARHGLADLYYVDQGSAFTSLDTAEVLRRLETPLVIGTAGYPEGRGAIERFNKTANEACLRLLAGRADVDPGCAALEVRLQHYLRERYNHAPHDFLGDRTPHECFHEDPRPLRFPESDEELRRRFVVHESRLVSPASSVQVDGVDHEMPPGYRGQVIVVTRRILDGTAHVVHQGRLVQIHPVDLEKNAHDRRARPGAPEDTEPPAGPLPKSAADIAFDRDFGPIVGEDGGFPRQADEEEEDR